MEKVEKINSSSSAKNNFKQSVNSTYYSRVSYKNKDGRFVDSFTQKVKEQERLAKEKEEYLKEHEARMKEQDERIKKLKAILTELEEKKNKILEKNIVIAPLKDELVYPSMKPKMDITDINTLNLDKNAKMKKAIKGYTSSPRPVKIPKVLSINSQEDVKLIETRNKPSLWSRIKNAIKNFFAEPDKKELDIDLANEEKNNYKDYNKYTEKSSEFRHSMASNVKYDKQIPRDLDDPRYRVNNKGRLLDRHI